MALPKTMFCHLQTNLDTEPTQSDRGASRGSSQKPCRPLLVQVVSEAYAGRYGAGRAREGRARRAERVVGQSAVGAAVEVAEEEFGNHGFLERPAPTGNLEGAELSFIT